MWVVQDAYADMVNRSAWAVEMTDAQLETMLPLQTDQVHCSVYMDLMQPKTMFNSTPQRGPACIFIVCFWGKCCLSQGNASSDADAASYHYQIRRLICYTHADGLFGPG